MQRVAWRLYLAVGGGLTVAYFAVGPRTLVMDLLWLGIVATGTVGVLGGLLLHRPSRPLAWRLLLTGMACFLVADALEISARALPAAAPRVVASEVIVLVGYLLIGAVALRIVRFQTPEGDRDGVIDGVIVMVALATVLWTVLFESVTSADTMSQVAVNLVSTLVPAGVTAACVRLLLTSGARNVAAALLATAGIAAFAGSLSWMLLVQADAYAPGGPSSLLWIIALLSAGASALHPSMVALTRPAPHAYDRASAGRFAVLGLALLTTPAALLAVADSVSIHIAVPLTGSAVLALLVLLRLGRLINDRERARRESAIRGGHQAALSSLAAEALTDCAVEELYGVASELVAGRLQGFDVSIRAGGDHAADGPEPGALDVAVGGPANPVAVLRLVATTPRTLSAEERDFLAAVANVLAAAVQRREAEDLLRHRALHDALTGLPNRSLLLDRLQHLLARRGGRQLALVFIDLDDFKAVNDTRGHDAGDQLLVTLARRLQAVVRPGDTVARLAGDEFVVVVDPCDDAHLEVLSARLLATIQEPVDLAGGPVMIGASIGALLNVDRDRDPEELLHRADTAMYAAKAAGGHRIVLAPPPSDAPPRHPGRLVAGDRSR